MMPSPAARARSLAAAAAVALLAGCAAGPAAYPSLASRATEKRGFGEPDAPPPAPVAADPALDARLRPLATQLDAIAAGFATDQAAARAAAGRAGARTTGSEAWIAAQTALAGLDDWRAQASSLATDLDALAGERAATVGTPYPALDALRERTDAEADRQAAAIAALSAVLPTP